MNQRCLPSLLLLGTAVALGLWAPPLAGQYAGSQACLTCHVNAIGEIPPMTGWSETLHSKIIRPATESTVDLDGWPAIGGSTVLPFQAVEEGSNTLAPITLFHPATDSFVVRVGSKDYTVERTHGGANDWKQRYQTRGVDDSYRDDNHYLLPIQFNQVPGTWVAYQANESDTLKNWWRPGRSYEKKCAGCHATGIAVQTNPEGFVTDYSESEMMVACEACHGKGGPPSHSPYTAILGPEAGSGVDVHDLSRDRQLEVCGSCHSRGASIPGGIFEYPFNETSWQPWKPGETLSDYLSDGGGDWPDGTSKQHHQQYLDFLNSPHYQGQFAADMTCFTCHDPHNKGDAEHEHQVREVLSGSHTGDIEIPVANDDNTLCLACHSTHGEFSDLTKEQIQDAGANLAAISHSVQRHTRHPYDPTGSDGTSRCSKCHMPKVAKSAVEYDIHSHTFWPIPPSATVAAPQPNSCALCHRNNEVGEGAVDENLASWTERSDTLIARWGDLYWGMWENGGQGGVLSAKRTTTPPLLDGDGSDAAWQAASPDTVQMTVAGVHQSAMEVELRAVYTNTDLYLLARWLDPTETLRRQELEYSAGTWSTPPAADLEREDRIGIFWPMTAMPDFTARGCMASCHHTSAKWGKYLDTGELGDLWHAKSARSWPAGYMDDTFVDSIVDFGGDGGRHGDASGSEFVTADNLSGGVPQWMGSSHDADPIALYLPTWGGPPYPGTWAVEGLAYDAGAGWVDGDRLPRYVMQPPAAGSDRADLLNVASYESGYWTVEMSRLLDTGNPDHDVLFTDLTQQYPFAVALIDNGTQPEGGAAWPNLHSHQGGDFEYLRFEEFVGVEGDGPAVRLPRAYALLPNYPNPFNPATTIRFHLPAGQQVRVVLDVFNLRGERVIRLVDGARPAGAHAVHWDGRDARGERVASGVYIYRLTAPGFEAARKMVVLK